MLLRLARHWERWRDEPSSMAMIPSPFGSVAVRHDAPPATAKRSRLLELCAGARALLADSRPGTKLLGRCTSAFHPSLIPVLTGADVSEGPANVTWNRPPGFCRLRQEPGGHFFALSGFSAPPRDEKKLTQRSI